MQIIKIASTLLVGLLLSFHALAADFTPIKGFDYSTQKQISVDLKKPLVVVFMSTICPCSDSHAEYLGKLAKENKKFRFVAIHSNQNETKKEGVEYFTKKDLGFSVIRDIDAKLADRFGAVKTPQTFVFDKKGEAIYTGPVTDSSRFDQSDRKYLQEFLASVNSGKPFKPVQKKPLGCYIVRSKQ